MSALVEVRDLHHRWPGGAPALAGVSFAAAAGEALAVVGANGAGKSTLLLHLVGLLRPTSGQVLVEGRPVAPPHLPAVRRAVGLLLQDPDDQLFLPSVAEDVAFGPRNLGLAPGEVEVRVAGALERVGASHLRDRPPHRLSAGEKRRCALAGVLALQPRLLALDEPTSHLDPRGRQRLVDILAGLPEARIVVTHDLDLARELCPRTLVLHGGRLIADGPTREILADRDLLDRAELSPGGRLSG